jgi:DNA-binding transcriptional MocR family regulator
MTDEQRQQGELFKAETVWFHVFKSMIENGDVAKMGPYAFTVYAVIKAHTNFKSGVAFPGVQTIIEKSGISRAQVHRALDALEESGYITREKVAGKGNKYTLREKVGITDDAGRPIADATWDYVPDGVRNAVAELKHVMMTGDFKGAKIIQIENLTVNFTQNLFKDSVQINAASLLENMDKLDPHLRELLLRNLQSKGGG